MEKICRLCCSSNFVNNDIFDEETALHLKMSLYMPIKVFRGDHLPQKICDRCSCRVNDLYQFCNEAIEVQSKLRAMLLASGLTAEQCVDLKSVKACYSPLPLHSATGCEQATQTDNACNMTLQPYVVLNKIKEEPSESVPLLLIKPEHDSDDNNYIRMASDNVRSDASEELTLVNLQKKKKRKKHKKVNSGKTQNGNVIRSQQPELKVVKRKRGRPPKNKKVLGNLEMLKSVLPEGTSIGIVDKKVVREEVKDSENDSDGLDFYNNMMEGKEEPVKPSKYFCCICFKRFKYNRSQMMKHYREHYDEEEDDLPTVLPETPPDPELDPARCPRCAKMVATAQWADHWRRHYTYDLRPYRCSLCEKAFSNPVRILKHGQSHADESHSETGNEFKNFLCDLCPEGFVYMKYLLAHRSRAHREAAQTPLRLRCGECSRKFKQATSLRRHLRTHTGERKFLCNICGKSLSSQEHLKFHIRIHTGYKPEICKTCGKGFTTKSNLTMHERVHTGEKPYICPHCNKGFSQRSTLTIHLRYHSGDRPYVCKLCNRGFVAQGLLSMHHKTTCI